MPRVSCSNGILPNTTVSYRDFETSCFKYILLIIVRMGFWFHPGTQKDPVRILWGARGATGAFFQLVPCLPQHATHAIRGLRIITNFSNDEAAFFDFARSMCVACVPVLHQYKRICHGGVLARPLPSYGKRTHRHTYTQTRTYTHS